MNVPTAAAKSPPSRGWYILSGILVAAAVAATSVYIVQRVSEVGSRLHQVVVPGEAKLTLEEPGSYTIFHEFNSVVDGEIYHADSVAGLKITVVSPDGRSVTLTAPVGSSRYSFSNRAGVSIFTFEVTKPGVYSLAAAYGNGSTGPKTVLTVGTGFIAGILVTVMTALLIMFSGIGVGVVIGVIVFLARRRARLAGAAVS